MWTDDAAPLAIVLAPEGREIPREIYLSFNSEPFLICALGDSAGPTEDQQFCEVPKS